MLEKYFECCSFMLCLWALIKIGIQNYDQCISFPTHWSNEYKEYKSLPCTYRTAVQSHFLGTGTDHSPCYKLLILNHWCGIDRLQMKEKNIWIFNSNISSGLIPLTGSRLPHSSFEVLKSALINVDEFWKLHHFVRREAFDTRPDGNCTSFFHGGGCLQKSMVLSLSLLKQNRGHFGEVCGSLWLGFFPVQTKCKHSVT